MKVFLGSECEMIGRSCNLVWFSFRAGEKDYALHVQCTLRFTKN